MSKILKIVLIFFTLSNNVYSQNLTDGKYKFTLAFSEHASRDTDATCDVLIKGNTVTVIHDGNEHITGKKGEIIYKGILLKHEKSGKWVVSESISDLTEKEIGACAGGPHIIDLKNKIFWSC